MPEGRVHARAVNGAVVIEIDPEATVKLAAAYSASCRDTSTGLAEDRPWWQDDVTALVNAATMASAAAQRVDVRFLSPAPSLCLVPGGEPA